MQKVVENYILYETVGAGQYGKVYRAKNSKNNETVAIKVVPLEKFNQVPKLEEFTTNEIKTLSRINNPNVVKFIEMLKTANNMYLVYEYCDGGTLEDILQRKHHLSEAEAIKIFQQLVNAFKAIYKENILHRDLKPSNILFHNNVVKVADFGFCKKMSSSNELTFTMVGSPIYMAPEILKGFPYNIKADIWSLGVVLYEMLFGVCPYEDKTLSGLIHKLDTQSLVIPREVNYISQNVENLLRKMLTLDYKQRIDWEELLNYPIYDDKPTSSLGNNSSNTNQTPSAEDSKPSGGLGLKLDLNTVNNYTDSYQRSSYQQELIIKNLMKERNKIVFVSNLLHATLELNVTNKAPIVAFLLLKKIISMIENLKKEVSVENTNSKFKNFDKWDDFRLTDEYLTFSRYLNEEHDEANAFMTAFKQEMQGVIDSIKDNSFKAELLNNPTDPKFLHSILVGYAEDIKNIAFEKLKNKDDNGGFNLLLHVNEILDCDSIEDFFDKILVDHSLRLSDQTYFSLIKKFTKEKLQELVQGKLSVAKNRIVIV